MNRPEHIILFDGVCNFCNASINYCIKHDKKDVFRFTTLQSATGKQLKEKYNVAPNADSVILIENEKAYTYSTAALRICRHLTYPSKFLTVFLIVPKFIRDPVYHFVARNRYKWFGKKESCVIPDAPAKRKFLD